MQHTVSNTLIYQSKNYKQFKMLVGNRSLNDLKIKKIIKDIEGGLNMLPYCPIVVDEDLNIIDGQHRYKVSKLLLKPVYYVIAPKLDLYSVAKVNNRTQGWKNTDYLNCYVQQGKNNYILLKDFIDKYKLPITSSIMLLANGGKKSGGGMGSDLKEKFQTGTFEVKFIDDANIIAQIVSEFKDFISYSSTDFIAAITILNKTQKCDFSILLNKWKKNPELLTTQNSPKNYLNVFELIYNYQSKLRKTIY